MTAFRTVVRLYRHASTLDWINGEEMSGTFCNEKIYRRERRLWASTGLGG